MGFHKLIFVAMCWMHGVSSESGFFWHVTDFHYDPTYWSTQLSCNDEVPEPGPYGDYWCDSNWRLVQDSIHSMATIKAKAEFVIWTGDSVAHIADADTSLNKNLVILQNITDEFNRNFDASVKFLPSLGNHDFFPSDQADVKQDEMYNQTADIWRQWIPDDSELSQFMNGGFYTLSLSNKIRLLSLNTNLYYIRNKVTKSMSDPAGQFVWMEKVLESSRSNGEKVLVTAHVTPGVVTPNFATWMYTAHQKRYVDILTNYSDVILASYYGHDHSDGFKIMQDETDNSKAVTQFVAPSITPWRFRAGNLVGKPHNPAIRLVEYDKETGKQMNYVQYYINLTDTNTNNQTNWTKLYDFKETYGVEDMSVDSLRKIFNRMKDKNGEELAQIYCNNALVSKESKACTIKNQFEIFCGGLHNELGEANKCVEKYVFGTSSITRLNLMCLVLILLTISGSLF